MTSDPTEAFILAVLLQLALPLGLPALVLSMIAWLANETGRFRRLDYLPTQGVGYFSIAANGASLMALAQQEALGLLTGLTIAAMLFLALLVLFSAVFEQMLGRGRRGGVVDPWRANAAMLVILAISLIMAIYALWQASGG